MAYKTISLFSGAGGMDAGFHAAGFDVLVAVEQDPSCCDTLRANMPETHVLQADISTVTGKQLLALADLKRGEVDAVIGGPPCQSFSLAGPRKGLDDPRGQMIREFVRIVFELEPTVFVLENVRGMLNWSGGAALRLIEDEFRAWKTSDGRRYTVTHSLLDAADFGVPQHRQRVFVVGNLAGIPFSPPKQTHSSAERPQLGTQPHATVGDAILDLPPAGPPSDVAMRVSGTIKDRRKKHGY